MKPNPKNRLSRIILSAVAMPTAMILTASLSEAVTTYTGAVDDWADETNWSPVIAPDGPAGAFNQRLNFTGSTTVTFTAAQGTVDLASSAGTDARAFVIGNTNPSAAATSVLNITGGILRASALANSASTGSTSLVGANGPNSNGTLNVSGTGTLDLTPALGASQRILSLGLGGTANTGISGTVNLSGSGLIKVSQFRFSENAPNTGGSITGVLNLNGGTLETGLIWEAAGAASALISSTVNLNGGLLRLTGTTGIHASVDTVNVLNGGANIEVGTGLSSVVTKAMLDGSGAGGLTKTGDGVLTLSGNNTYTGPTKINAGTLRFATKESLYNNVTANWTAANISALSGATLAVNADSAGTAGFTNTDIDALLTNVSVANTATEGLQAGAAFGIDTTTATGASFTQGNPIADSTGANGGALGLTKLGAGLLILDKANTYTGPTTISAGSILATASNALGATTGGTTIANGGMLQLQGGISYPAEPLTLGSGGASSDGVKNVSGDNTWNGPVTTTGNSTAVRFGSDAGTLTLANTITGIGAATQLVFQGVGNITVSGQITGVSRVTSSALTNGVRILSNTSNNYTGVTAVNGGTLGFASIENIGATSSALGAPADATVGTINVGSLTIPGTLRYTGNGSTSDRIINLSATSGGSTIDHSGTGQLKFTSALTATTASDKTLTLSGSTVGTGEIAGAIVDSAAVGTTALSINYTTGATNLTLGSVHGILLGAAISGTGIPAATTVSAIDPNTRVVTISAPVTANAVAGATITVAGVTNPTSVAKSGTGTWTLSGANTYTGTTSITGGTLALGANDVLPNASNLTIGAATLNADTFDDTIGTLAVTAAATINLSAGANLIFADSNLVDWTGGTLNITGSFVSGSSIKFATSGGLTPAQLALITINGTSGSYTLDSNGFLTSGIVVSGFAAWQAANSTAGTPDLDHDNDGVSNGVEWFLGGTTNTTGFTPLPSVTNSAGTLSVTWVKAATFTGTYGSNFLVETSPNLIAPWTTATIGAGADQVEITGDNIKYTFPTGTRNFARLRVISTP